MDLPEIGRQLRARRAATGRTVASVAANAGLSVPYIANLENGRGNPTLTALSRLAAALGMELAVTLQSPGEAARAPGLMSAGVPASLVRFSRSARFRRAAETMAQARESGGGGQGAAELSARLVAALAGLAQAMGTDPGEADWSRIIDALLLVAVHPAG